jgi:hypothetical protein
VFQRLVVLIELRASGQAIVCTDITYHYLLLIWGSGFGQLSLHIYVVLNLEWVGVWSGDATA